MDNTSASLLEQLKHPGQEAAWQRFVNVYQPILLEWASRHGLQPHDAADLVQEVLLVAMAKLPEFQYDKNRSFKAWLRRVAANKHIDWLRRQSPWTSQGDSALASIPDKEVEDVFWEVEYRQFFQRRVFEIIECDFQPATAKVFRRFWFEGQSAADSGRDLGLSPLAVNQAVFRVKKRLADELAGQFRDLLD